MWVPFFVVKYGPGITVGIPQICDLFDGCKVTEEDGLGPSIEERATEIARSRLNDDELVQLVSNCLRPGFKSATVLVEHIERLIAARKQAPGA